MTHARLFFVVATSLLVAACQGQVPPDSGDSTPGGTVQSTTIKVAPASWQPDQAVDVWEPLRAEDAWTPVPLAAMPAPRSEPLAVMVEARGANEVLKRLAQSGTWRQAITSLTVRGEFESPSAAAFLRHVPRLPNLVQLDLSEATGLRSADLRKVCRSGTLRCITLPRTAEASKADAQLAALAPMQELEVLRLTNAEYNRDGLIRGLGRFSNLQVLRIEAAGTEVADEVASVLARLPALRHLRIDGPVAISDRGFHTLLGAPSLERLHLGKPYNLTPVALQEWIRQPEGLSVAVEIEQFPEASSPSHAPIEWRHIPERHAVAPPRPEQDDSPFLQGLAPGAYGLEYYPPGGTPNVAPALVPHRLHD